MKLKALALFLCIAASSVTGPSVVTPHSAARAPTVVSTDRFLTPVEADRDLIRPALAVTDPPVDVSEVTPEPIVRPTPTSSELPVASSLVVVTPPPSQVHTVPAKRAMPTLVPAVAVGDVQAYALAQLGPTQYTCLANIVHRENPGWVTTRYNMGGSGAYGIPQSLPGSKMASAGSDWRTNGVTQVKWMIGYMNGRYGSACRAWVFWQGHSSY